MNRIRFRVWGAKDKKWMGHNLHIDPDGFLSWDYGYSCEPLLSGGNIIVMQDTGLQDKNGSPIYEDDILEFSHYTSSRPMVFRVIFLQGRFREKLLSQEHEFFSDGIPVACDGSFLLRENAIKIVGNMHESPHLFTEETEKKQ